jgi:hypothetical protein
MRGRALILSLDSPRKNLAAAFTLAFSRLVRNFLAPGLFDGF